MIAGQPSGAALPRVGVAGEMAEWSKAHPC
jgi:hypothetical protein